jgi:hypothetical protein
MSYQKKSKSKIRVKKSKTRKHRGGSYASDIVMAAANGPAVRNDFVSDPRVRDGPNADYMSLEGAMVNSQKGGSESSDMTMKNLLDIAKTNKYVEGWKVKGDINSLNTYQPSGGKRKSKHRKSHKRNHKSKNHKSNKSNSKSKRANKSKNNKNNRNHNRNHNHIGGASAYMADFYAKDSNKPQPNEMWNPPSRDSAGSGYPMGALEGANVGKIGAPIV